MYCSPHRKVPQMRSSLTSELYNERLHADDQLLWLGAMHRRHDGAAQPACAMSLLARALQAYKPTSLVHCMPAGLTGTSRTHDTTKTSDADA